MPRTAALCRKDFRLLGCAAALALAVAIPAGGAGAAGIRIGDRVAIVFGNGAYAPPLHRLPKVANDVDGMGATLRQLGFDIHLTSNASLQELQAALARMRGDLKPNGVALFYYSGHALQYGQVNYLLPVNFQPGTSPGELGERAQALNEAVEAVAWYQCAADEGNLYAPYHLARLYRPGRQTTG